MLVKLLYFKQTGKYYSEGSYESKLTTSDSWYNVIKEIEEMFLRGERPGLCNGRQEFDTFVGVVDHPDYYPVLIKARSAVDTQELRKAQTELVLIGRIILASAEMMRHSTGQKDYTSAEFKQLEAIRLAQINFGNALVNFIPDALFNGKD